MAKRILTDEQIAMICSRYAAGEKTADLAPEFRVAECTIREKLRKFGKTRGPARVQRPVRHDAFDALNPDVAYWLGFMFTDGTINRRPSGQPEIALALQGRDREHLEKFRDFLGSDHAITPIKGRSGFGGKGHFRYSVRSRLLAERLDALGRYGPAVNPELAASRDFWRGAVDGDGCIGLSCGVPQVKLFGSQWLLGAYLDFVGAPRKGSRRRPLHVRPSRSIYVVSASSGTAAEIIERLYVDAGTVLDRKAVTAGRILAMKAQGISMKWPAA